MAVRAFITPCGPFDDPISHFRTALLTVATALAVVFCAMLLTVQPEIDKMTVDLVSPAVSHPPSKLPRRFHQLVIDKRGRMMMDGARVSDRIKLRHMLDAQQSEDPVPDLQLEPDPEVRYETFIDALYVIKRAHVYRLCIDWKPPEQRPDLLAAAKQRCAVPGARFDGMAL